MRGDTEITVDRGSLSTRKGGKPREEDRDVTRSKQDFNQVGAGSEGGESPRAQEEVGTETRPA